MGRRERAARNRRQKQAGRRAQDFIIYRRLLQALRFHPLKQQRFEKLY